MTEKELSGHFKEFQKDKIFTIVFGEDIVNDRIFFKIYKNNLTLEEQYNIVTKIKKLEIDQDDNIYIIILENKENRMNGNYNGTPKKYFEEVIDKYRKINK